MLRAAARAATLALIAAAAAASGSSSGPGSNAGASPGAAPSADVGARIGFDLSRLDAQGLYGPADGLRALDYGFCIPDRPDAVSAVRAIDPSVRMYRAPGRIGCPKHTLLCIGNTHQSGYREVLSALSRLAFVERIEQVHFE